MTCMDARRNWVQYAAKERREGGEVQLISRYEEIYLPRLNTRYRGLEPIEAESNVVTGVFRQEKVQIRDEAIAARMMYEVFLP
jgi:hypothetical protein